MSETNTNQALNIYLDTNALRSLSFSTHIAPLLHVAQQGVIRLYLSEVVVWERARQYYETEGVTPRLVTARFPLPKIVAHFRQVFEDHGAIILETLSSHVDDVASLLEDKSRYFQPEIENDRRDALIFSVALSNLTKHDTLILCEEHNLSSTFEQEGYTVRKDTKTYVEEITANITSPQIVMPDIQQLDEYQVTNALSQNFRNFLRTADSQYFVYERELPALTAELSSKLSSMQTVDHDVRNKVLGFAQWFSPVSKAELKSLLETGQYMDGLVENSAQRLRIEDLLVDTGNHWLPNTKNPEAKQICEQAMASVMPEIIEKLGLA